MNSNQPTIPKSGDDRLSAYARLRVLFPDVAPDQLRALIGFDIQKDGGADKDADLVKDNSFFDEALNKLPLQEEWEDSKQDQSVSSTQYPYSDKTVTFNQLSHIEFFDKNNVNLKRPSWYNTSETVAQVPASTLEEFLPVPLAEWKSLWPQLKSQIGETTKTKRVDINKLVKFMISQKPLKVIPRRNHRTWPADIILLIDESPHLTGFQIDYVVLASQLLSWFGKRVRLVRCTDASLLHLYENGRRIYNIEQVSQQTHVVYLGDLGFLASSRVNSAAWLDLTKKIQENTQRLHALLFTDHIESQTKLHNYWQMMSWGDTGFKSPADITPDGAITSADVRSSLRQLIAFLSFGFEVTPAIVREARKQLGFAVELESLVLQLPIWIGKNLIFQWKDAAERRSWQAQGFTLGYKESAIAFFKRFEKRLPTQLQVEQRLRWGHPLNDKQTDHVQQLIASLAENKLEKVEKARLQAWLTRVIKRSDSEKWDGPLAELYFWFSKENASLPIPKGIRLENMPDYLKDDLQPTQYQLIQKANKVELHLAEAQVLLPKQSESQLVSSLSVAGMEIATVTLDRQSYASIAGDTAKDVAHLRINNELNHSLVNAMGRSSAHNNTLLLTSKSKRYTISQITCPPWANELARDRIGLYADFSYKNVVQRFRWIPPGEFMMGSPESERGRWDDEGPVHLVQIESGYWMAETACTQSFWTAVMGNNPSEFSSDPENPVENVSWLDCQQFLKRLNEINADLQANLPSEAQWEYACRAGTQTPYSFGEELTSENANYSGDKAIGRTVKVKSYKRNPWGLYQMHGNVWEWCEDDWHGDYKGAPTDGSASLYDDPDTNKDGQPKVVRGGAWLNNGRFLRSACRNHYAAADERINHLGFRVSLGPAPVTSLPKTGSRGKR